MSYSDSERIVNAQALWFFGSKHVLNWVTVQGDFVRPGKTFTLSDGVPVTARVPILVVADADVPDEPVGKSAVCEDENYTVAEVLPDGFGLTVLELERTSP